MASPINGHEFEQTQGDGEGQGSLVCCSPWGHEDLDMTKRLNNNNNNYCIAPGNLKTGALEHIRIYLEAELLEHRICRIRASSISVENISFSNSFFQFTFPPAVNESSLAPHPCQCIISSDVSILYNLMSAKFLFLL